MQASNVSIAYMKHNQSVVKETDKFRLYLTSNLHAYLTSKVGGRPSTVSVRRKGGDFNYLRNLNDGEFNASACLEFGCGLYQS